MTQNELIWALFTLLQGGVFSFVAYWTRRVQNLESAITKSVEERTQLQIQFQGRVSRLESQYEEIQRQTQLILKMLERIERRLDGRLDRRDGDDDE